MEKSEVSEIIEDFRNKLNVEDRERVVEKKVTLNKDHMKNPIKPETRTKSSLIDPVLRKCDVEGDDGESYFDLVEGIDEEGLKSRDRWVDYDRETEDGRKFLIAAKKANSNLKSDKDDSAVNQISELFKKQREVHEEFSFGIATDGFHWIFIDDSGEIAQECDIRSDFRIISRYLKGHDSVISESKQQEITDKFYDWYDSLLDGGRYTDLEGSRNTISSKDCLVENIHLVDSESDRKQIAQAVMDRLIFIKFIESRNLLDSEEEILRELQELDEDELNEKLNELFFRVLAVKEGKREDISEIFGGVPYLNGNLFNRIEPEKENPDYYIGGEILDKIIEFLNKFGFSSEEEQSQELDPKILGHIFERAMNSAERKSTGAYYTPKPITQYMAEETIHSWIVERANEKLKEKNYKEGELLEGIDDLFTKPNPPTISDIMTETVAEIEICDNACGSGAFLLTSAEILLDLWRRAEKVTALDVDETWIRKTIVRDNLYGVDLNPNAIEIAKLRMWLWIAESYEKGDIEALPNLDYNLRQGNSLVGYKDISKFVGKETNLSDFYLTADSLVDKLEDRSKLIHEYKAASGNEAKELKKKIEDIDEKISTVLDGRLLGELQKRGINVEKEDIEETDTFHWGFEFFDVFNPDAPDEEKGFDIIIGNPPYFNVRSLDTLERNIAKDEYNDIYDGSMDVYCLFTRLSSELMSDYGRCSLILSRYYLEAESSMPLKNYLKENTNLKKLIDFRNNQLFVTGGQKIDVLNSIMVFDERGSTDDVPFLRFKEERIDKKDIWKILRNHEKNEISEKYLTGKLSDNILEGKWLLLPDKYERIIEDMRDNSEELGNEEMSDIGVGIQTGRDNIFIVNDEKVKNLGLERDLLRRYVKNGDLRKFKVDFKNRYMLYVKEETEIESFPNAYQYLKDNRDNGDDKDLEGRYEVGQDRCKWYSLSVVRNEKIYDSNQPKIITPYQATENRFFYDNSDGGGFVGVNDIYSIKPGNPELTKYIVGLLNSNLLQFYHKNTSKLKRDHYYEYFSNSLEDTPIKIPDEGEKELVEILTEYLTFLGMKGNEKRFTQVFKGLLNPLVMEIYFPETCQKSYADNKMLKELITGKIEDIPFDEWLESYWDSKLNEGEEKKADEIDRKIDEFIQKTDEDRNMGSKISIISNLHEEILIDDFLIEK